VYDLTLKNPLRSRISQPFSTPFLLFSRGASAIPDYALALQTIGARPSTSTASTSSATPRWSAAAELADRYISDRFLPDKAIDLIDEAASRTRIKSMTAPPVYRDLEEEIETTRREKEQAIES
jgi:AAA lid domain